MIVDIIQEIDRQAPFKETERQEMESLLTNLQRKCSENNLKLTFDRWVAVGAHLINMLRRRGTQGAIPPIEDSMWEQISVEMVDFSEQVLAAYRDSFEKQDFQGEVFLLAVHFETAKLLDQGV